MGVKIFDGLYSISNELGQIRAMTLTPSTSHVHLVSTLRGIQNSIRKYGLNEVEFFFTDDPDKDAAFLRRQIPSLNQNVVLVSEHKFDHLPIFKIPPEVKIVLITDAFSMETVATLVSDSQTSAFGFDLEWCAGGQVQGRIAVMQIAHEDTIFVIRVRLRCR